MNCRPGDLAMLVHTQVFRNPECYFDKPILIDPVKIVKVVKLLNAGGQDGELDQMWSIEEPLEVVHHCIHGTKYIFAIGILSDKNLRPIRDPGDTVQTDNPVKIVEPV